MGGQPTGSADVTAGFQESAIREITKLKKRLYSNRRDAVSIERRNRSENNQRILDPIIEDSTFDAGAAAVLGGERPREHVRLFICGLDILHDLREGGSDVAIFRTQLESTDISALSNNAKTRHINLFPKPKPKDNKRPLAPIRPSRRAATATATANPSADESKLIKVLDSLGFFDDAGAAQTIRDFKLMNTTVELMKVTAMNFLVSKFGKSETMYSYSRRYMGSGALTKLLSESTVSVDAGFRKTGGVSGLAGVVGEVMGKKKLKNLKTVLAASEGRKVITFEEQVINSASGNGGGVNFDFSINYHKNTNKANTTNTLASANAAMQSLSTVWVMVAASRAANSVKRGCRVYLDNNKTRLLYASGDRTVTVATGTAGAQAMTTNFTRISPNSNVWISNGDKKHAIIFKTNFQGPSIKEIGAIVGAIKNLTFNTLIQYMLIKAVGDENQMKMNRARNIASAPANTHYIVSEDQLAVCQGILHGACVIYKDSDTYVTLAPMWVEFITTTNYSTMLVDITVWLTESADKPMISEFINKLSTFIQADARNVMLLSGSKGEDSLEARMRGFGHAANPLLMSWKTIKRERILWAGAFSACLKYASLPLITAIVNATSRTAVNSFEINTVLPEGTPQGIAAITKGVMRTNANAINNNNNNNNRKTMNTFYTALQSVGKRPPENNEEENTANSSASRANSSRSAKKPRT